MFLLQNFIHFFEVGAGGRFFSRTVRLLTVAVALIVLGVVYDLCAYKNFSTQEAMDSAQLARNISKGKGYTTMFIRPLSVHLVRERTQRRADLNNPEQTADLARLNTGHPDLANPPVYPVVLAGLMKVLPFHFAVDLTHPFWSRLKNPVQREFWRYQPDFLIAVFNQVLFVGVIVLAFKVAKRLFDREVAWLSALLLLGSELFWRFTVSGLSTIFLLLIFLSLVWCLIRLEEVAQETNAGRGRVIFWAILGGVLVGLGGLTRYSFGWLIVPVIGFIWVSVAKPKRPGLAAAALLGFGLLLGPWMARNYVISGLPFGTATYSVVEGTPLFPEHTLERALDPRFSQWSAANAVRRKWVANTRQIVQNDLPRLGGTWVSAFFLTGLMISFKKPTVRRVRYFLLGCVVMLTVVQALGRTQLSEDSPDLNSENLLVLLAPLVLMYGASLFYLLLDQIALPAPQFRPLVAGVFGIVASLPLLLVFLPPRNAPISYPPYYPPAIQQAVGWTKPDELIMSDIPWAIAWYGQSQCAWLTLDCQGSFLAINDEAKPIQALYISRLTLDSRFLAQMIRAGDKAWGQFILNSLFRKSQGGPGPPAGFPLQFWQPGWPDQFLLTFREHWPRSS